MRSINQVRKSFLAVLLVAGSLAACAEAPTAAVREPAHMPALNTAPAVTVTNSGGYPLITWGALAGATGYTVEFIESRSILNRTTFETWDEEVADTLANTTDTSYLDSARSYTGRNVCTSYGTFETRRTRYGYRVTAHYASGDASTNVAAPVSPC